MHVLLLVVSGNDEQDERSIAQLMLDQIEFANVILLSKVDLVEPEAIQERDRKAIGFGSRALDMIS